MRWRVPGSIRWRQLVDELVLLDVNANQYFTLDEVGACVWERLRAGESFDQVVAAVVAGWEVDVVTARADLERLVDELVEAGLLTAEVC